MTPLNAMVNLSDKPHLFISDKTEPIWLRTCRQLLELCHWYGAKPICFYQNGAKDGDIPYSELCEDKYGRLSIRIDDSYFGVIESNSEDVITLAATKEKPVEHTIRIEL